MHERRNRILRKAAILVGIGVAYAIFVSLTGIGIPCVFNLVTGYQCPSCGISRMFIAMFHLKFREAFAYNPVIFCMLIPGLAMYIRHLVQYIKYGSTRPDNFSKVAVAFAIVILVTFGIVRNLPL